MGTERQIWMGDYRPPPWPEDFPQRLERLKEMAGISWKRMAELVGVTDRGALKWRRGGSPLRPTSGPSSSWRARFPAGTT